MELARVSSTYIRALKSSSLLPFQRHYYKYCTAIHAERVACEDGMAAPEVTDATPRGARQAKKGTFLSVRVM